jgi:hypothetical protein
MADDVFHGCDLDEVLALVFDLEGADGLRALLGRVDLDKESLNAAADKLETAGLVEGAKMVRDAAKRAKTRSSIEIDKLLKDDDVIRQKAYFATLFRRGQIILADLVPRGIDSATIDYVAKARRARK